MIRRNIEVEAHLIDDLLDVTGIIRGKLELTRQPVDVRPLIEHAMQNYCAGAAMKKNLRVSIKITAAETHVLGDSFADDAGFLEPDAKRLQIYSELRFDRRSRF